MMPEPEPEPEPEDEGLTRTMTPPIDNA